MTCKQAHIMEMANKNKMDIIEHAAGMSCSCQKTAEDVKKNKHLKSCVVGKAQAFLGQPVEFVTPGGQQVNSHLTQEGKIRALRDEMDALRKENEFLKKMANRFSKKIVLGLGKIQIYDMVGKNLGILMRPRDEPGEIGTFTEKDRRFFKYEPENGDTVIEILNSASCKVLLDAVTETWKHLMERELNAKYNLENPFPEEDTSDPEEGLPADDSQTETDSSDSQTETDSSPEGT